MIWFVGDLHGIWSPLIDAIASERRTKWSPHAVVLLGDVCAARPLKDYADVANFHSWYFIHGNHDTDSNQDWSNLMSWEPEKRWLHAKTLDLCGVQVAGLGGVFRKGVWMPDTDLPKLEAYKHYEAKILKGRPHSELSGRDHDLLLRAKSTIFPQDCIRLLCVGERAPRCDVLVTHEAPSVHEFGHQQIDRIAKMMQARLIVHGHHHQDLDYPECKHEETKVIGVGGRGIVALDERNGKIFRVRKGE